MGPNEINIPVNIDTSSANQQMNTLIQTMNKLVSTTEQGFSGLSGKFDTMSSSVSKLSASGGMLTKTLGEVKEGFEMLAANPWIAVATIIAILIVKLIQNFSKMEAVSDSLGKAFASLSMIFKVLMDKILTPLIDIFVKIIEFGVEVAQTITKFFSPAAAEASKKAGELAKSMDDLDDSEKKFALSKAESNAKVAEARDLAMDETKSIGERKDALKVAAAEEKKILEEGMERDKKRAQNKLLALAIEMNASKELLDQIKSGDKQQLQSAMDTLDGMKNLNRKELDGVYELQTKVEESRAQAAMTDRKLTKEQNRLDKEEKAKAKEEENKRKEASKKAADERKKQLENEYSYKRELSKLNSESDVIDIKDKFEKEIKLENEKNKEVLDKFKKDLIDKKLTKKQYNDLVEAETKLHDKRLIRIETEAKWESINLIDEINSTKAKTEADKDAAKRKKIQDDMNYELSKVEEGSLQAQLIKAKYKLQEEQLDEEIAKRNEKRRQDSLANTISEDELRKKQIENIVVDSEDKYNQLSNIEQKIHDDKVTKITDAYNVEKQEAEKNGQDTTEITRKYNTQKLTLDIDLAESQKKLAEAIQEVELKKYDTIGNAAESLGSLLGKETAAGKALGIANALISTYTGVARVWEAKSTLPSPFDIVAKVAGTATTLASGLKAVQQITAVKVPGGGGGGNSGSGGMSVSSPSFSAPQVFGIGGEQIKDFKEMQAQKVIVTESDITRQQNRVSSIRKASIQGG